MSEKPPCITITLLRNRHPNRNRLVHTHTQFKNSLAVGVGYLELANAGDFAANVWNEIPVPKHAVVLMAIFGPTALLTSLFALQDLRRSLANIRLLRSEREMLQYPGLGPEVAARVRATRGLNTRQLLTEVIDRAVMDVLLGIGAVLVGTGTIMAIFGANRTVFDVSNLLSGFVGNAPAAVFGVLNAVWSVVLVVCLQRRWRAAAAEPGLDARVVARLRVRLRALQAHAAVNGVNGLVAGMASMVTARMWWGYVVLIPCVVVVIAGNWVWRTRLGYDRGIWQAGKDEGDVVCELREVMEVQERVSQTANGTLEALMQFLVRNGLFEGLCEWLATKWEDHPVFRVDADEVCVSPGDLMAGEQARMLAECRRFLQEKGRRILEYRERYLLELLGEMLVH